MVQFLTISAGGAPWSHTRRRSPSCGKWKRLNRISFGVCAMLAQQRHRRLHHAELGVVDDHVGRHAVDDVGGIGHACGLGQRGTPGGGQQTERRTRRPGERCELTARQLRAVGPLRHGDASPPGDWPDAAGGRRIFLPGDWLLARGFLPPSDRGTFFCVTACNGIRGGRGQAASRRWLAGGGRSSLTAPLRRRGNASIYPFD